MENNYNVDLKNDHCHLKMQAAFFIKEKQLK